MSQGKFKVGDRLAPGLNNWWLSNRAKLRYCPQPDKNKNDQTYFPFSFDMEEMKWWGNLLQWKGKKTKRGVFVSFLSWEQRRWRGQWAGLSIPSFLSCLVFALAAPNGSLVCLSAPWLCRSCPSDLLSTVYPYNTAPLIVTDQKESLRATGLPPSMTELLCQPMTVFEKILTHLFLITSPSLQALAFYKP